MASIEVKAMVDKEKNRIIFLESYADFVDVLFGFLTMPMGTIIRLIHNQPPKIPIGCMNNLYRSVETLDKKHFRTRECKSMLLRPQNGAETQFKSLKIRIDELQSYWYICSDVCAISNYKLLSRYAGASCACGGSMNWRVSLQESAATKGKGQNEGGGVFVKGLTRHLITDDLQIIPLSSAASFSVLSRLGVENVSAIEERTFDIGAKEVLNLLKCSLVSKIPLTETLLKPKPDSRFTKEDSSEGSFTRFLPEVTEPEGNSNICIRLMISKSKKVVCYADATEDFIDLLFSFLTVPLGHTLKEMLGGPSKGCALHLYQSVQELDAVKYFKSDEQKQILLCPKLAPFFRFEKQLLDVQEALNSIKYYYARFGGSYRNTILTTDKTRVSCKTDTEISELTAIDPKCPFKKGKNGEGGFLIAPSMFTVTDDLIIIPISPLSGLSILNKLQVAMDDVEEYVVHVGKKEASSLLVASYVSETALTDVFLRKEPKREEKCGNITKSFS